MKSLILLILLVIPLSAWPHIRLKGDGSIPPRSSDAAIKTGPCGGLPRSANPTVLQKGSTITVTWEETIDHPGRFEFYFSPAAEANFTLLKTVQDTQDNANVPHQFSTTLTLPNQDCTDCTIQLIQVMTEDPNAPSLYYSCADIKLQSTAGPPPVPPPPLPPGAPTSQSCH